MHNKTQGRGLGANGVSQWSERYTFSLVAHVVHKISERALTRAVMAFVDVDVAGVVMVHNFLRPKYVKLVGSWRINLSLTVSCQIQTTPPKYRGS